MGFLDKLLGRTKDTAREIGDKAAPLAEKTSAAVGGAVDKAEDLVDDMTGGANDEAAGATDHHPVDAVAEPTAEAAQPAAEAAEAPAAEPGTP